MGLSCLLGMAFNPQRLNEAVLRDCAAAGVAAIEISPSAMSDLEGISLADIRRWADDCGVALWSFHLPFWPFEELDLSQPALAKTTVETHKMLIDAASALGIRTFVVHASGESIDDSERAARIACAKESLCALAAYAAERGGVIAVEDLPRTCLGNCTQEVCELLSADDRLRVCCDTNHLLQEPLPDFIRAVGDRIVTTHISDYDFINERHWLPGEGQLDWAAVTAAFAAVGYRGYWLYEIGFVPPHTIDRDRDLNCADFRRNYDQIMAGKRPTPIGTPKPHLGM